MPKAAGHAESEKAFSAPQYKIYRSFCRYSVLEPSDVLSRQTRIPPAPQHTPPGERKHCQRLPRPCPSSSSKRARRPGTGPSRPGRAPLGADIPCTALSGTGPRWRGQRSAGTASPARPRASPPPRPLRPVLTFVGGRGRQTPPRGGGLRGLRWALSHAVLHQLEVRRVERVVPRERRDGREHGDLRRARRAERCGTRKPLHGAAAESRPRSHEVALPPGG